MSLLLIFAIIIILATFPAVIFKQRFKIQTTGPLCFWRTHKGLHFLDRIAKYKKFWIAFADIGLIFCFGIFGAIYLWMQAKTKAEKKRYLAGILIGYAVFVLCGIVIVIPQLLLGQSIAAPFYVLIALFVGGFGLFTLSFLVGHAITIISNYLSGIAPVPGIQPVIPGVEIPGARLFIPFHAIVGLVIIIIVHEIAHGVLARAQKLRVKSFGLLTIGIFPIGAFTEPDDEQLRSAEQRKRLRVFTAGSMSNFTWGFIFMALLIPMSMFMQPGLDQEWVNNIDFLLIKNITPGSPAEAAGILPGMKIYNANDVYYGQTPGKQITLVTDQGNFNIIRDNEGLVGISKFETHDKGPLSYGYWSKRYFLEILSWTVLLNFVIGYVNFMPLAGFDGGQIFNEMALSREWKKDKRKGKKKKVRPTTALKVMSAFILAIIIINILPYFF